MCERVKKMTAFQEELLGAIEEASAKTGMRTKDIIEQALELTREQKELCSGGGERGYWK